MPKSLEIVFNDEFIVVVNKLSKIVVQPTPKKEKWTLTTILEDTLKEKVFPCHRLDRETSGLIVYAKAKEIQQQIMEQFKEQKIKKRYFALVRGRPKVKRGMMESYILDREGKRFGEKPKLARTKFKVIRNFSQISLLDLEPLTGRSNQIRIHLVELGCPILGESKYALRKVSSFVYNGKKYHINRLALHSYYLKFIHPRSNKSVEINIGLPKRFQKIMDYFHCSLRV